LTINNNCPYPFELGSNNKYKGKKEGRRIDDVKPYISLIRKKAYRESIKGFWLRNDVSIKERMETIKDILNVYKDIKDIHEGSFINSE